ncbi:DNA polymerase phi-domain-containing protein [Myxozyma melibiosi]|uniref:DNA polymerase phi-domain-containing protein n=1 Tax=Myxozyma melibiosi TaxID=54550 RepID=A0ABR1FBL0_9ASCO
MAAKKKSGKRAQADRGENENGGLAESAAVLISKKKKAAEVRNKISSLMMSKDDLSVEECEKFLKQNLRLLVIDPADDLVARVELFNTATCKAMSEMSLESIAKLLSSSSDKSDTESEDDHKSLQILIACRAIFTNTPLLTDERSTANGVKELIDVVLEVVFLNNALLSVTAGEILSEAIASLPSRLLPSSSQTHIVQRLEDHDGFDLFSAFGSGVLLAIMLREDYNPKTLLQVKFKNDESLKKDWIKEGPLIGKGVFRKVHKKLDKCSHLRPSLLQIDGRSPGEWNKEGDAVWHEQPSFVYTFTARFLSARSVKDHALVPKDYWSSILEPLTLSQKLNTIVHYILPNLSSDLWKPLLLILGKADGKPLKNAGSGFSKCLVSACRDDSKKTAKILKDCLDAELNEELFYSQKESPFVDFVSTIADEEILTKVASVLSDAAKSKKENRAIIFRFAHELIYATRNQIYADDSWRRSLINTLLALSSAKFLLSTEPDANLARRLESSLRQMADIKAKSAVCFRDEKGDLVPYSAVVLGGLTAVVKRGSVADPKISSKLIIKCNELLEKVKPLRETLGEQCAFIDLLLPTCVLLHCHHSLESDELADALKFARMALKTAERTLKESDSSSGHRRKRARTKEEDKEEVAEPKFNRLGYMFTEMIIQFSTKASKSLRTVCENMMEVFCTVIGEPELNMLTEVLGTKESLEGLNELFNVVDEDGEVDGEFGPGDVDMEDAGDDDSEEEDDDESSSGIEEDDDDEEEEEDEDEEEDEEEDEDEDAPEDLVKFERKLGQVLGVKRPLSDDEEDEEEEMDDEQMLALDDKLSAMFKNRVSSNPKKPKQTRKQQEKSGKLRVIEIKNRVLGLLRVYVNKIRSSPNARKAGKCLLSLLWPILQLVRSSDAQIVPVAVKFLSMFSDPWLAKFECDPQECFGLLRLIMEASEHTNGAQFTDCCRLLEGTLRRTIIAQALASADDDENLKQENEEEDSDSDSEDESKTPKSAAARWLDEIFSAYLEQMRRWVANPNMPMDGTAFSAVIRWAETERKALKTRAAQK